MSPAFLLKTKLKGELTMNESTVGYLCLKSEEIGNNGAQIETHLYPIGSCPSCNGMVFDLDDKFACINSIDEDDICKFNYPKCFIDDAISPNVTGIDFGKLILGPTRLFSIEDGEEMEFELINYGGEDGWGLKSR